MSRETNLSGGSTPPSPRTAALKLQIEGLGQHVERLLQRTRDDFNERFEMLERRRSSRDTYSHDDDESQGSPRERRGRRRHGDGSREDRREREYDGREREYDRRERDYDRRRREHHRRGRENERIEGVKIKVPSFHGRNDVEAYLEWEMKIEQIFSCHNYSEEKKLKVAALEFRDYALIWWDQVQKDRRRYDEDPVDTWEEMKNMMRRRFVPSYYHRELHTKLQRLTQGGKSVDEYFKEMEVALIRANVVEEREATMARFLHGLNHDIRDVVELQPYVELEDLVHQAMKVEQQLKRKGTFKKSSSNFNTTSWKDKSKEGSSSKETGAASQGNPQTKSNVPTNSSPSSKNRDIKCFKCLGRGHIASQCPNKKTMVMRDNGSITSEDSNFSSSSSEEEDEGTTYAQDGDLLVVRRLLGSQAKEYEESQRENIFHTRCLVQGKVCSMIIDGGSCTNVASTRLVTKLNLKTTPHPRPYKLQWLSNSGELVVNQQVMVNFSIGKYEDQVVCDVVPMEAGHILLGRPWQFDKCAQHDGFSNKFSFIHNSHKVTLVPLSPREVCEDQIKMREKKEQDDRELRGNEKESEKKKVLDFEGKIQKKWGKEKKRENEGKEERKVGNLFTNKSEVKRAYLAKQPLFLLVCNNSCLDSNANSLPSEVVSILQEFKDAFPKEVPHGLPPMRGIEHQIEKKMEHYAQHANKGWKKVVFDPGDWVWINMRKEWFPMQRKSKLRPRGDGPFQVLQRINDNAYKIDLPGEYGESATFNVSDLCPFDVGDEDLNSRMNSLKEGGDDENQEGTMIKNKGNKEKDPLQGFGGPMTRSKTKRVKEALNQMVTTMFKATQNVEEKNQRLVHCVRIEDYED